MEATLEKIKYLEHVYVGGDGDDFMDRALRKLVAHQLAEDKAALSTLRADLVELERRYGLRSEEFAQRYRQGYLDDSADFVEWNALYRMFMKLQARLNIIQG